MYIYKYETENNYCQVHVNSVDEMIINYKMIKEKYNIFKFTVLPIFTKFNCENLVTASE